VLFDALDRVANRVTSRLAGAQYTHTPTSGTASTALGRFERHYSDPFPSADGGPAETRPVIWLVVDDLTTSPRPDDTITVGGVNYLIESLEPDGTGQSQANLRIKP